MPRAVLKKFHLYQFTPASVERILVHLQFFFNESLSNLESMKYQSLLLNLQLSFFIRVGFSIVARNFLFPFSYLIEDV